MSISKKDIFAIICAIVAGLISTLLAHTHSFAQTPDNPSPTCSSADYIDYRYRLKTEPVEGAPAELLAVAEAFLETCNTRPEAGRVALQAARNALDTGDAEKALAYFDMARKRYAAFKQQDRLDYITTLVLNGQTALAWSLRDEEINLWLDELYDDGLAEVETIRLRDGLVHKVTYHAVDSSRRETVAWLAAPFGSGFPATISLSSEKAMISLLKLRLGDAANGLQQLILRRCHGQNFLLSDASGISAEEAQRKAMATAKAYLRNPDGVFKTRPDQPIATCYNMDRLFIAPDPKTATPLY